MLEAGLSSRSRECRIVKPVREWELYGPALATICEWVCARRSGWFAAQGGGREVLRATPQSSSLTSSSTNLQGLVWIAPVNWFRWAARQDEVGRGPDEGPQRQVVIPQGFWIECEVSQAEYEKVMGIDPATRTLTRTCRSSA